MTREEFFEMAKDVEGQALMRHVAEHVKHMTGRQLRKLGVSSYKEGQSLMLDSVDLVERLVAKACGVTVETVEDLPATLWSLVIDAGRGGFFLALSGVMPKSESDVSD